MALLGDVVIYCIISQKEMGFSVMNHTVFIFHSVRIKILLLKEWWSKGELANVIYYVKLVII